MLHGNGALRCAPPNGMNPAAELVAFAGIESVRAGRCVGSRYEPQRLIPCKEVAPTKLGGREMSRNRTNLANALIAVGAIGATAGMLAWRWSQRHRAQRSTYHRELNRWEDEGGSLESAAGGAMEAAASARTGTGGTTGAAGTTGTTGTTSTAAAPANGAAGEPWPFPHGNA
jgi:hypothetical protein